MARDSQAWCRTIWTMATAAISGVSSSAARAVGTCRTMARSSAPATPDTTRHGALNQSTTSAYRVAIAGLTNPTIVVPAGARVSIQLINADTDMAHGLVVTSPGAATTAMPMMTAAPAFPGAALWFLGEATPAGLHTGTLTFTATTPGNYQYLCPVPGHAQKGMIGNLVVTA